MSHVFTTETRLSEKDAHEIMRYAREYVGEYSRIQRYVWHRIAHDCGRLNQAKLNTEIQKRFHVTKRTANSVIFDMKGRYKALKALKYTELYELRNKIDHLVENAEKLAMKVDALKEGAKENRLSVDQLQTYRNLKKSLFYRHQKIQRYKDRMLQLQKDIDSGSCSIGFGSRKMFRAQYRPDENGYGTHEKWYRDFVRARDKNIFFLGSADETASNQMFQLTPCDDGTYKIMVRKDSSFVQGRDKYVYGSCSFRYLDDELKRSLVLRDRPVSYRFKIRGRKVFLQAVIRMRATEHPVITTMMEGAIGIDFNSGHIDIAETDSRGNLTAFRSYKLHFHGTGTKAENEMRQVVSQIGTYALMKGKSLVKEDLSFVKKKSNTSKRKSRKGKDYNKMLHALDYSRYEDAIVNMTFRSGIDLIEVNPAYTSKIARQKYCSSRKIPIHNGAAYVIARRGQGFRDKYIA